MHASALTKERSDTAEAVRSEFEPRVAALTSQLDEQSNAFAALEADLTEERNRSDNLNELANERREALTKTTEKLEEMEERYEDAKWHLEKARHFEKLVRRRKKLIANLISTIRARQKANNTLKAGLDSLRRYKATAAERQQELLRRVEILENSLKEAREKVAQANEARRSNDADGAAQQQSTNESKTQEIASAELLHLQNQVMAQADVIQNLEADLKKARKAETEARTMLTDHEKLHDDIETKNTFIGTLQKDIEEQQKTLALLRKRDIEVQKLRAVLDEHERKLTVLQTENAQLRTAKNGEIDSIDQKRITDQEQYIGKLTAKLKEYEASIATLSEAADSWKRKYDFLAAETPYGFESASSK
jgi:DNA repair exonuclease SbcCD ATPase subunit